MDASITYLGEFRFANNSHKHREPYWASHVRFSGIDKSVVDAAGIDKNGANVVRLLPYSNGNTKLIDSVLQDGDLLAYVQGPKRIELQATPTIQNNLGYIGDILKGRATHAELGYLNDTHQAMQVSLWGRSGPMAPEDRRFFNHTDNDTNIQGFTRRLRDRLDYRRSSQGRNQALERNCTTCIFPLR